MKKDTKMAKKLLEYQYRPCLNCNKTMELIINRDIQKRKFCCRKCVGEYYTRYGISGMTGKKHNEKTKIKMANARIGKAYKLPFISEELRNTKIKRMKDLWNNGIFDNLSDKMKNNNPMKNLKTINKMKNTKNKRFEKYHKEILERYLLGESADGISKNLKISIGAILRILRRNNINIRLNTFKQAKLKCDDGHIAESNFERSIDNWLFHHNIVHTIHYKVFENRKINADFKVGDILIEGDGLEENRPDKNKFLMKLQLYRDNNLKYLVIKYNDDLNIILSGILKYYNNINSKLEQYNNVKVF